MGRELAHISVQSLAVRIVLIVLLLGAAVCSYFVVRWYTGNTLAEYFTPGQNNMRVAEMAVGLAPNDPLTHWRMAQVAQKLLPLDQQGRTIEEYERAVSLSPNDYRFWMALGTAHEQAGDSVKGELALRRAVALAPSYAYPRWYLGNLLLRSGRYDEAFKELRLAAEADEQLEPQQFNFLWAIYGDNLEALKTAMGEGASRRARFALYQLQQQRPEDGLRVWDSLSGEEKKQNRHIADAMIANLLQLLRYHDATKVWNDIAMNERYRLETGKIFDGSFEEAVSYGAEMPFGWQVKDALQLQIGIDPTKAHSGSRSLRIVFQVRTNLEALNISQLIPVMPNSEYDFEFYLRTEKLETGSAPMVQIFDGTDGGALAGSPQAPSGSTPWTRVSIPFKTGSKTEAVILRFVRLSCSDDETPICPIFGSVWYDDFSIQRRR